MKNLVQDGDIISVTAPYARSSGDFVQTGDGTTTTNQIGGICITDIANGATGQIKTTGVYDITAKTTDTAAIGDAAYWDNTNKYVTVTSSGNNKIGAFMAAKANTDTTARVRLNGTFPLS